MTRSRAWDAHPEHVITVEPHPGTVSARFGDILLAESSKAVILREGRYPPVIYFPRSDVRTDTLTPMEHTTHCPFKGDARYWSVTGEEKGENAVWGYDEPFEQMESIREHVAFYVDRVTIEATEPVPGP